MADDKHEQEPTQEIPTTDGEPLVVPVPTRGAFDDLVRKVAGRGLRKRPAETDAPPDRSESD
jgi:hypothetical protein